MEKGICEKFIIKKIKGNTSSLSQTGKKGGNTSFRTAQPCQNISRAMLSRSIGLTIHWLAEVTLDKLFT